MKQLASIITLGLTLILSGCASTNSSPVIVAPQTLDEKKELLSIKNIKLVDSRQNKALGTINGKALPINKDTLETLELWLNDSTTLNPFGSKTLQLDLQNYGSFIKQESMSFTIESVLNWQITLSTENKTWKKSYQTTMTEQGPLSADNAIIEKHLNLLASKLLNKTFEDEEFNEALFN